MCVRERLLTGILKVQIHETENIYNRQAQLDKVDVEICRRLSGFNFRRRAFPPFSAKATIIFPTLIFIYLVLRRKYFNISRVFFNGGLYHVLIYLRMHLENFIKYIGKLEAKALFHS